MTTIATDGKSIAADGMSSSDIVESLTDVKIRRIGKEVVGCAGTGDISIAYLDYLEGKRGMPIIPDSANFYAVHVSKGKVSYVSSPNFSKQKVKLPYAIGSGGQIALGAMLAGASPGMAVRIAGSRDYRTGGRITELLL